jgi:hypothetical protein
MDLRVTHCRDVLVPEGPNLVEDFGSHLSFLFVCMRVFAIATEGVKSTAHLTQASSDGQLRVSVGRPVS